MDKSDNDHPLVFTKKGFFTYENKLILLLFLTFGLVFMDKMSFTFLLPFIADDLGFSNTQSGAVIGIIAAFFGVSTLIFSSISDLIGSKKENAGAVCSAFFRSNSRRWLN